ncbi:PREDICTED: uncharacterized protein LOC105560168 [Vollenhovia emeryi]|uniref:uncharacterized protein LOC105560168 n=1 Tax=Vollenhovia emeryi TaxID=411798 RepID=UPI0005F46393|nr:PREDICTED: uncharacterized protein LOC105560168 [Vollenhovia emeryi]
MLVTDDLFIMCLIEIEEIDRGTSTIVLNRIDSTFELLNRAIAELEWQTLANRSIVPSEIYMHFVRLKVKLRNEWCAKLMDLQNDGASVNGKLLRFLCKGPKYTDEIARKITAINEVLSSAYNSARICKIENYVQRCYSGELDVGKLMATSRRVTITAVSELSSTRREFSLQIYLENRTIKEGISDTLC